jgi:formylglycine-generating enzyme required for sulfatase activity
VTIPIHLRSSWVFLFAGVLCGALALTPPARSAPRPGGLADGNLHMEAPASYTETMPDSSVTFDMVGIPGGTFLMGSPDHEPGRSPDEGPQVEVTVGAFWMARHEVTWDEFDQFAFVGNRGVRAIDLDPSDADALTRPTLPYGDEARGFGKGRQPAVDVTWHGAMAYCRWLSERTGKTYRLPTEAEWEYAARAGAAGAGPDDLEAHAWHRDNADFRPQPVATKAPNALGLHDMLGNVAEWTIEQYHAGRYATLAASGAPIVRPVALPDSRRYPHVTRGGSFDDRPGALRYANRFPSSDLWSLRDPQQPRSIWWHTDASHVGLRVVRPVEEQPELRDVASKITRDSM